MSRKYDCKHLRRDALNRLTVEYPSALKDWDATQDSYTRISGDTALPIDVVNTAAENSFNRVLPAAFLACIETFSLVSIQSCLPCIHVEMKLVQEQILVGVARNDGTTATLSPDLQKICIIGVERFNEAMVEHTFKWLTEPLAPTYKCSSDTICAAFRALLLCSFFHPRPQTNGGLMAWSRWASHQKAIVSRLCQKCQTAGELAHEEAREEMWEQLPSFFGFSEWDELENK
jgi:hypothetical protein